MLPVTVGSHVKSGVIPPMDDFVAMIQRAPAPPLVTLKGTCRRIWMVDPSQLNAVRRVAATELCATGAETIRISTYWAVGSPPTPDITSSIRVRWKVARAGQGARTASMRRAAPTRDTGRLIAPQIDPPRHPVSAGYPRRAPRLDRRPGGA